MRFYRLALHLIPFLTLACVVLAASPTHTAQTSLAPADPVGAVGSRAVITPTVWLPLVARNWCPPVVALTSIPAYGSSDDLVGRVWCAEPASNAIAVAIYVGGWWTKPTFDSPLTPIQSDGSWTCDITTGGADPYATQIAAFLVPEGYSPPLLSGAQTLPAELFEHAEAYTMTERNPPLRTIQFSGYTWKVKASDIPVGPGPNLFSNREEDVWVDEDGRLHMSIVQRDGQWVSTEVILAESLGYGTYTFVLSGRVDLLDRSAVLGMFTWDDGAPDVHYREIDIELSRWEVEENENAQFVVQPWDTPGNTERFDMVVQGEQTTHRFAWSAAGVDFASFQGAPPSLGDEIASWLYEGADTPPAGEENVRINLWLILGHPPSDGQPIEVVVEAFQFTPAAE